MPKHLVWDWNGTLFDDFPAIVTATNHAMASVDVPGLSPEEHRARFFRPLIDFYSDLTGRKLSQAEFETLDKLFHDRYALGVPDCPLTTDAPDAIASWTGTQSLLSMWFHDDLVPLVTARGLIDSFSRVDGLKETVGGHSKYPYLLAHLEELGVEAADCVLIGDSVDDADAARSAGAACVLYSGGFTAPQRLRETGMPVVNTLTEAVELGLRA